MQKLRLVWSVFDNKNTKVFLKRSPEKRIKELNVTKIPEYQKF